MLPSVCTIGCHESSSINELSQSCQAHWCITVRQTCCSRVKTQHSSCCKWRHFLHVVVKFTGSIHDFSHGTECTIFSAMLHFLTFRDVFKQKLKIFSKSATCLLRMLILNCGTTFSIQCQYHIVRYYDCTYSRPASSRNPHSYPQMPAANFPDIN